MGKTKTQLLHFTKEITLGSCFVFHFFCNKCQPALPGRGHWKHNSVSQRFRDGDTGNIIVSASTSGTGTLET